MPSLPSKTTRQKHVTPIANLHENDVWQRTFKLLGLQPLTPFPGSGHPNLAEAAMDVQAPTTEGTTPAKEKLTIRDLPEELQKEIFKHSSSTDLIALCLVSKHFRDIGASLLYRNFHIVFPDEDDPSYESPIDGLAGGLDTLVTSEYNYSRFLKEIVLDTLSGGSKGERAYRHYTYDMSCGKFMSTLFLLSLRKARALETFKWDLRVEISRPVFKALHQIAALQNIHIRMHSGPSLYETPPPLPSLASPSSGWQIVSISSPPPPPPPPSLGPSLGGPPPPGPFIPTVASTYTSAKHHSAKAKMTRTDPVIVVKSPPTLSGFKNLKSLTILDMDTLEYIEELRECMKNSSSTLRKVKLSFSENLARQARKPPPAEDPNDESDQELDEFGQMNPPPPPPPIASTSDDFTGPAKTFRAQEEKKSQEAVLGRIFGVEPSVLRKADGEPEVSSDVEEKSEGKIEPGKVFIKDLTSLSKKLMNNINGSASRTQQQKEALEFIEKAAKMYVSQMNEKKAAKDAKLEKKAIEDLASEGTSTAKPTPESSAASVTDRADDENNMESKPKELETTSKPFGVFRDEVKKTRKSKEKNISADECDPDDINIDEPEMVSDLKDFEEGPDIKETQSIGTQNAFDLVSVAKSSVSEVSSETEVNEDGIPKLIDDSSISEQPTETDKTAISFDERTKEDETKVDSSVKDKGPQNTSQEMNEYLRRSHGIPIETLAIYLIPIKASVLSKAIDFYALKQVTLLNVGTQAPFWNLLKDQNKQSPLPLTKIYTDHVSLPFLTCVSQLETVAQLFMLERNSKIPEYSFASKTTVTMDQIRRIVLKKHIGTLERLMIKNDNDSSWDATEQVLKLICKRGRNLEELAVCFGVRAVHTFNQYLPGLIKLRALHIISFRNDDTCHWVVREVRKFAVDSVSHNPEMKLEYIGMENTVERLVRRIKQPKPKDKGKAVDKGKGKESEASDASAVFPTLDSMLVPPIEDESSEDESGSEDDLSPGLKLETLEGVRFYDVFGIQIFRKDIMAGRL